MVGVLIDCVYGCIRYRSYCGVEGVLLDYFSCGLDVVLVIDLS